MLEKVKPTLSVALHYAAALVLKWQVEMPGTEIFTLDPIYKKGEGGGGTCNNSMKMGGY